MAKKQKPETERLLRTLKTALRLLGFTNREIERRLGYTPSYLTRLFSGQIELRFEHIVDIVEAIGMTLPEFFAFAYPGGTRVSSEPARQLTDILDEIRPLPPFPVPEPPALSLEDVDQRIKDAVQGIYDEIERRRERRKAG
jgi:transcriptional regulator with XRE-family HTH domain